MRKKRLQEKIRLKRMLKGLFSVKSKLAYIYLDEIENQVVKCGFKNPELVKREPISEKQHLTVISVKKETGNIKRNLKQLFYCLDNLFYKLNAELQNLSPDFDFLYYEVRGVDGIAYNFEGKFETFIPEVSDYPMSEDEYYIVILSEFLRS